MSTRTSVRPVVQAELAEALKARTELVGVSVMDGVNARDFKVETIVIGNVRSALPGGVAYMQAGRKQRKDQFIFDVDFWACADGQTPAAAKARAAVMLAALEDILADNATFANLHVIQLTAYEGPDAESLADGKGFGGYITAHVECQSQQI